MQNMAGRRLVFIAPWFGGYVFYRACTSLTQRSCLLGMFVFGMRFCQHVKLFSLVVSYSSMNLSDVELLTRNFPMSSSFQFDSTTLVIPIPAPERSLKNRDLHLRGMQNKRLVPRAREAGHQSWKSWSRLRPLVATCLEAWHLQIAGLPDLVSKAGWRG